MADSLAALRTSADRLAALVASLGDGGEGVRWQAYPAEWTVADVVAHLGSGAVIFRHRMEDSLAGRATPDDFNASVWAEWDAKDQDAKAADGIAADGDFMAWLEARSPEERAGLHLALGPMQLGWDSIIGMRLNEHALHEWDVAVTVDQTATLAGDAAAVLIDNLGRMAARGGKSDGSGRTITVHTTDPERRFALTLGAGGVELVADGGSGEADVEMPAEALVRLVAGRLDPDHTPSAVHAEAGVLDDLRRTFPGY